MLPCPEFDPNWMVQEGQQEKKDFQHTGNWRLVLECNLNPCTVFSLIDERLHVCYTFAPFFLNSFEAVSAFAEKGSTGVGKGLLCAEDNGVALVGYRFYDRHILRIYQF